MSIAALAFLLTNGSSKSHRPLPYLDPSLPANRRAADLVGRMTLPEKISQMQHEAPAVKRLGVPAYTWWSEALHGAVGNPVTVFPQAIGLGASFDTGLVGTVATAISDEGRARYAMIFKKNGATGMHEGLDFWAPNINIFRDPRWGRGQETYGEDPYLTGQMAFAYITHLQGESGGKFKAIATPKHFAVHSGPDRERHHFNAVVDTRDMWNTYLPAFRSAIVDAGAWSIMSAYSAVNGEPDSASPTLLKKILRDDWGFGGYVVSDCGAIYDIFSGHHAAPTLAQSDALAVNAGCDLECGDAYKALQEAVAKHYISTATIDQSLKRLFEARIRLGMFDPASTSGPWKQLSPSVIDSPAHRALALKAARESVVLLKNDGLLPLKGIHSLAVIGPNADDRDVPLGNYNGTPKHTVSVVEGLKNVAPADVKVTYLKGSERLNGGRGTPIPASVLEGGVDADYFKGQELKGDVIYHTHTDNLEYDWGNGSPNPIVPNDHFSARYTATLVPKATGDYQIGTRNDDGARLFVDGKLITEDWGVHAAATSLQNIHLEAGRSYKIVVEYFEQDGQASVSLVWAPPMKEDYADATELANRSDAVVMVLGISGEVENEENDRKDIDLPSPQQGLLRAVLATGKPVVVVLESGSCLTVSDERIRGLVQAWYPGEFGGTAVAEVLFGKTNPGGRLPVTFYKSLAQVPPIANYKMDNRTYRYLHAKPLYPFGYGLSYTKFAYSGASASSIGAGGTSVKVLVKNTGNREGDEVVQVYSSRLGATWPEPSRKLVGFTRVHLGAHQAVAVRIPVTAQSMAQADGQGRLKVLPGRYTLSIGGGQPGLEPATSGRVMKVTTSTGGLSVPNKKQRALPQTLASR